MSYGLTSECGVCIKKDKCTDRHFIEGAISGIHQVWPAEKGHLGSGTIIIQCQRLEQKELEVKQEG